jgi:hypothetical protein
VSYSAMCSFLLNCYVCCSIVQYVILLSCVCFLFCMVAFLFFLFLVIVLYVLSYLVFVFFVLVY